MKLLLIALFMPFMALAQDVAAAVEPDLCTVLWDAYSKFGGLDGMGKVALIVNLLIVSMRISKLQFLWDKLGSLKILAGPALGLIGGFLMSPDHSLMSLAMYALSGSGANLLHELLHGARKLELVDAVHAKTVETVQSALSLIKLAP